MLPRPLRIIYRQLTKAQEVRPVAQPTERRTLPVLLGDPRTITRTEEIHPQTLEQVFEQSNTTQKA